MFVSEEPTILHADLDAFYASVEQRDDPRLRGRPVIVGGGVVLAASYEAKARGVRTAMGGRQARRLCPDAIVVPPRMEAYSEASKAVFEVFENTTPLVEGAVDRRGVPRRPRAAADRRPPAEIAERLRRDVREQVGLPITVGVARTKFLAKVASGVAKPDGLLVVPPEGELAFLHPLPVERLWGVGPVTAEKLHAPGITTVGEVARTGRGTLVATLGARRRAATSTRSPTTAIRGRCSAAGAGARSGRSMRSAAGRTDGGASTRCWSGSSTASRGRLRAADRVGRTVVLRLRFDDFTRATRSHTLPTPTARTRAILAAARGLLAAARR